VSRLTYRISSPWEHKEEHKRVKSSFINKSFRYRHNAVSENVDNENGNLTTISYENVWDAAKYM